MDLSQKVGKLGTGAALKSAKRHLRRIVFGRRPKVPLVPEKLIAAIDPESLAAIRQRHEIEEPGAGWPKYLNLTKWMQENIRRVEAVGLDFGGRKRILDLGCGSGYFLFIAKMLGHEVRGLDVDEVPMFGEMMALLGIPRVIARVEPFVPLPAFETKFDLITAFMICFNGHKSAGLWGEREWEFFLDDLETRLAPGGRICLGFNRETDGRYYSQQLLEYFLGRGATAQEHLVVFRPSGRPPRPPARRTRSGTSPRMETAGAPPA